MTGYGPLATNPAGVTQATSETIAWGVDVTNAISTLPDATPTSASVAFYNLTTGASPSSLTPSISGNIISFTVVGSTLVPNNVFRVAVTYHAGGDVLTNVVTITVPF
jgi:hypothetical protein